MDPQFFRVIDIVQDGDCFMRSSTIHLNKALQDSKRGRNNQLLDKVLRELEQSTMLAMRLMIVNSIEMEKGKYEKEIYYDEELYENIDDRIEKMYKKSEFVGLLEIKKMAEIFNIQINIFSPIKRKNTRKSKISYNHICTYGFNPNNICNLLLDNNHYDLLILKPECEKHYMEILNIDTHDNTLKKSRSESSSSITSINASEFDYEMVDST